MHRLVYQYKIGQFLSTHINNGLHSFIINSSSQPKFRIQFGCFLTKLKMKHCIS